MPKNKDKKNEDNRDTFKEETKQSISRYSISVRALAEHVHRTGGLSSLSFSGISGVEGTRLHNRVFSDLRTQYEPSCVETEYSLYFEKVTDDIILEIKGRADCVLHVTGADGIDQITLLEIKSYAGDFSDINDIMQPVHWAQMMLYAHMFLAASPACKGIYVSLRYVSIETLKYIEEKKWIDPTEAAMFFDKTCDSYIAFARDLVRYKNDRDISIMALTFPYSQLRPGQKVFMQEVVTAISHTSTLFVEAPTGIGKTISTLFPSIKSLVRGKCDRIFYLTAKTSTRIVAQKALADLRNEGLLLRSITLQAKESLCVFPDLYCDTRQCAFAADYYIRLPKAISELLLLYEITPKSVLMAANKYSLCPHELMLDISQYCDVIIGDYNHAFNPRVKLERYFNQPELHHVLLVDEAHNLVDRSRDMYSAVLLKSSLTECQKSLRGMDARADGHLADIMSYFQILTDSIVREEDGFSMVEHEIAVKDVLSAPSFRAARIVPKTLYKMLWKFCYFVRPVLDALPPGQIRKNILSFFFDARFFLSVLELYFDDAYVLTAEVVLGNISKGMETELVISLSCLDASSKIHHSVSDQHAAVFFSATLSPTYYYTSMLLGDRNASDAKTLTLSSPFPPENLSVGILNNIKTTYLERNYSIEKVTDAIISATLGKTGNFLIYLPSFAYLRMLSEAVISRIQMNGIECVDFLLQTPSMNNKQKADFLDRFEEYGRRTLYAFAVLGGHFGEGIDLVGERLSGVLIVGVGLPLLCPQREIMRQYFQEKFGEGFAYAYRFPGWEKVLQAAGRVIRNEEDTGFVLLMDERYDKQEYRMLFPEHWHVVSTDHSEDFTGFLTD
jgi:DNA excision repair protein ERCC-2